MMGRVTTLTCAALLCLDTTALKTQETPRDVARGYFDALLTHQWDTASALVDPVALTGIRDQTLAVLAYVAGHGDEFRRMMSEPIHGSGALTAFNIGLPDAANVAKYGQWRVPLYPGSPTIMNLATLPPVKLLAQSYEATRVICMDGDCSPFDDTQQRTIIRTVVNGDSTARVIYRRERVDTPDLQAAARNDSLDLRRRDGKWRVELTYPPIPSLFTLVDKKMGIQPPPK